MNYTITHRNRVQFPSKSILIVEDCLLQQARFAKYFLTLFGHQSNVRVNFVSTALEASNLIFSSDFICEDLGHPRLVILDHDLQFGNGVEFVGEILRSELKFPIIAASGIDANNKAMMKAGANHEFIKNDIIEGKAEALILEYVGAIHKTVGWESYI